jgi:hypothetical protein
MPQTRLIVIDGAGRSYAFAVQISKRMQVARSNGADAKAGAATLADTNGSSLPASPA